jgi:protein AFG1
LDRLYHDLLDHDPPPLSAEPPHEHEQPRLNTFFGFFGRAQRELKKVSKSLSLHHYPKGVYLHGGVGCGKTFVMDMFYNTLESIPTWHDDRQKVHFHKFMLDVHQQMHESKYVEGVKGDVLPSVIQKTLEKGRLICFDEFQVTDVADALILRRLFTGLLEQGAVIVATSNRPPDDLYLNGLQRDRFLPFIDLLKERCEIVSLWDSETDYRLIQAEQKAKGVYFVGKEAKKDFKSVFYALTKNRNVIATSLTTQGRSVSIPMACLSAGVARFTFEDLCTKALGAADYLVIAQHFHTVFVSDIPVLTLNEVNYLRRFITFIDVMYECHVKLIIHAKAAPSGLFEVDLNNRYNDEVFAFDRTRSRLEEMGSDEYLQKRWAGGKQLTLNYNLKVLFEPSLGDNTIDAEPTIGARAGHGTTP